MDLLFFQSNLKIIGLSLIIKKNGKELDGYIYKDRIKYLSDFRKIPFNLDQKGEVKIESGNIKVEIIETKFIKEKHKLKFYKNNKTQLD